jgi:hypothetical protein
VFTVAILVILFFSDVSFARTFTNSNANINIPSPAVWYVGKFCFNPISNGPVTFDIQGGSTSSLVLLDDQPFAWPYATASTGFARAGTVVSTDLSICNTFLTPSLVGELNASLPFNSTVLISDKYRRNWYFAFANCGSDSLSVSSYTISMTQSDGNPLSCEKIGKYELFATYFSFSFVALLGLAGYAKKLGIPVFSFSSPHALMLYALIFFTLGLTFVLADADAQRGSGNLVPQVRQSFGFFLLQMADWMMIARAFSLCTGIVSIDEFKSVSNIMKGIIVAFCLTYFILSIISIAVDGSMYDQSDYSDAQPVNSPGVGISVLRFLLFVFLCYSSHIRYRAESALESKSFLKTFYLVSLTWQFVICVCIFSVINADPNGQMISVWGSTLTFNFLYLIAAIYLLMSRWTDVPAGTKSSGNKQPFIDDDHSSGPHGSTPYQASL